MNFFFLRDSALRSHPGPSSLFHERATFPPATWRIPNVITGRATSATLERSHQLTLTVRRASTGVSSMLPPSQVELVWCVSSAPLQVLCCSCYRSSPPMLINCVPSAIIPISSIHRTFCLLRAFFPFLLLIFSSVSCQLVCRAGSNHPRPGLSFSRCHTCARICASHRYSDCSTPSSLQRCSYHRFHRPPPCCIHPQCSSASICTAKPSAQHRR